MTRNISRRLFITLFVIAISTFTVLAQTKESSPDRFARLDALRVHYRSYGDGKNAIVFIHGWTCNLNFWKANIPAFTNQLRVIAIDLPGHGESDKPEITYSMDLFARAIVSHFLMMDDPQKFNETVLAFLEKNKLIKH